MLVSIAELIFAIVILTSAMAYLLIGEELALNKVKHFWILESQVELKTYFIEKNNIWLIVKHFIIIQSLITRKINVPFTFSSFWEHYVFYSNNRFRQRPLFRSCYHVKLDASSNMIHKICIYHVYRDIPRCTNLVRTMNKIRCFV